jgi:hypothetical protein
VHQRIKDEGVLSFYPQWLRTLLGVVALLHAVAALVIFVTYAEGVKEHVEALLVMIVFVLFSKYFIEYERVEYEMLEGRTLETHYEDYVEIN